MAGRLARWEARSNGQSAAPDAQLDAMCGAVHRMMRRVRTELRQPNEAVEFESVVQQRNDRGNDGDGLLFPDRRSGFH
jgi:hypothetical protein